MPPDTFTHLLTQPLVLAVVILEVLITGAIYMAQQEYRVGWSADQSLVAFNMTERGRCRSADQLGCGQV